MPFPRRFGFGRGRSQGSLRFRDYSSQGAGAMPEMLSATFFPTQFVLPSHFLPSIEFYSFLSSSSPCAPSPLSLRSLSVSFSFSLSLSLHLSLSAAVALHETGQRGLLCARSSVLVRVRPCRNSLLLWLSPKLPSFPPSSPLPIVSSLIEVRRVLIA